MLEPSDFESKTVQMVRLDSIRILNPRARNRRSFQELVESISKVGLKRPITIARKRSEGTEQYDLVCGQGRLEAFIELKQEFIPAFTIDASEDECLVMSLVENCARRQHRAIDHFREVSALQKKGYDHRQIATKIGVGPDYVGMILFLLDNGEEKLLAAVDAGQIPLHLAIEIARADDEGAQRALAQAYTEKKLQGKKLVAVRRLLQQRSKGRHIIDRPLGKGETHRRPLTSESIVRIYRQEAERQKLMIKKAEVAQSRLLFVVEAMRALLADEQFFLLLRDEGLDTIPAYLEERLERRALA